MAKSNIKETIETKLLRRLTRSTLTINDVADQLEISPIDVHRLIAQRRLTASRLVADDGSHRWRIKKQDLETFLSKDIRDLKAPEQNGDWFKADHYGRTKTLGVIKELGLANPDRVRRAMNDQKRRGQRLQDVQKVDLKVIVTEEIRKAVNGPVVNGLAARIRNADVVEVKSLLDVFVEQKAMRFAKDIIADKIGFGFKRSKLEYLYLDPPTFTEILEETVDRIANHEIRFAQRQLVPYEETTDHGDTKTVFKLHYNLQVNYFLPLVDLIPRLEIKTIVGETF